MHRIGFFLFVSTLILAPAPRFAAAGLPVPTGLAVVAEDTSVLLRWNGGPLRPDQSEAGGVTGYRVTWTEPSGTAHTALTTERIIQVQPLLSGSTYTASVQSVDALGALSAASAPITFSADGSRVAGLRQTLTGFFDDFNLPMGAPDEKKWNVATSLCDDPTQTGFFINDQSHVHTMVAATNCDRGQIVVRPRNTFDFTNRTGTIAFDFDGSFRRDQWYLDLVQPDLDITGQVAIESGDTAFYPGSMLRLHQNEQVLEIIAIGFDGHETTLARTDFDPYKPLDWLGLKLIPNVRRHWVVTISQSRVAISIDGTEVLAAAVALPFSRATVLWNQFSYNTPKSNEPFETGHWDNFGFDGAPSPVETHNYRAIGTSVVIPDSLAGAVAARLRYSIQMPVNRVYNYSPIDNIAVNGRFFLLPQPTGPGGSADTVSAINPYSASIALPPDLFVTGTNTIAPLCFACAIHDTHVEIDFPAGQAPAYSQAPSPMPPMIAPPPGATVTALNGAGLNQSGTAAQNTASHAVTGAFTLDVEATQQIAMNAVGKNLGIATVELRLDGQRLWQALTNGTPRYTGRLSFNDPTNAQSLTIPNGTHALEFVATDALGRASSPDYFQADARPGDSYPIFVSVSGAPAPPGRVALTGVNLAAACFTNAAALPGVYGTTYTYPTHAEVDYALAKGESVIRLCFQMENLMQSPGANFDPTEEGRLDDLLNYATGKGLRVILDPHNFGRYFTRIIGQDEPLATFSAFWTKLATRYKANPLLIFELMNEPNSEPSEVWWTAAQAATNAIRATGATNLILVPGNGWDSADSWALGWYGTPNAALAVAFSDPGNNYAYEAHEYLDGAGGTLDTCTSSHAGSDGLAPFVNWLRANGKKGYITEFGAGRNDTCYLALSDMLAYMAANSDVLSGWTYWAAGPWWGDYRYTVEPDATGADRPQMVILRPYFDQATVPAATPTPTPKPTPTPVRISGIKVCVKAICITVPGAVPTDVRVTTY